MSLKYFHYLFIVLSVLCTLLFGAWALSTGAEAAGGWGRLGGALSALVGLLLVAYGIWFARKSKQVLS